MSIDIPTSSGQELRTISWAQWWSLRQTGFWSAAVRRLGRRDVLKTNLQFGTLPDWVKLVQQTRGRLARMRDQWKGSTVVCVGNGPSINQMDLRNLNGQFLVGTNRAFMLRDRFDTPHFHLLIQDHHRISELLPEIRQLDCPVSIGNCHFEGEYAGVGPHYPLRPNNTFYLPRIKWLAEGRTLQPLADFAPGISWDPIRCVNYGFSVIFSAIQFAVYFGAKKVVCIGIDMDYSGTTNFAKDVKMHWEGFSYEVHCRPMFALLRERLEKRGIQLINATPGGKVDALVRQELPAALSP